MINLRIGRSVPARREGMQGPREGSAKAFDHLVNQADMQRDARQHGAAAALYAAALDLDPSRTDIRVQYANMLKDGAQPQAAEIQYRIALSERPDDPDIFLQLGRALLQLNRNTDARASLERYLALESNGNAAAEVRTVLASLDDGRDEIQAYDDATVYAAIASSDLFDPDYYRRSMDRLPADAEPIRHYIDSGSQHHVRTSRSFSGAFYYARVPESRHSRLPALAHALLRGDVSNGRQAGSTTPLWGRDVALPDLAVTLERLHADSFFFRYNLWADTQPGRDEIESAARFVSTLGSSVVADPQVTIVIPVYGQTLWCLNCLESLAEHRSRYSFEVLVYDDASPASHHTAALSTVPWVRYVNRGANKGFIGACNAAAEEARGDYLVFLNSDTRVCEGWLDELIGTFDLQPKAGLVGSKLFNGDGSLQEAGCIVWRDGSAWNYGRNDDPNDARYCFARQTAYCSGAAIALRTSVWRELRGFDVEYSPAYYEDVDLAFRVKEMGLEVWYQPLARVIHYEGKTHGTDVEAGIKAYQTVNAEKFRERWASVLLPHRPNGYLPLSEADRSHPLRVLAFDAETPAPDRDAGSVMTFKLLQLLQRLGWHVTFLPVHDTRYRPPYSANMARIGIETVQLSGGASVASFVQSRPDFYAMVLGFRVTVLADLMRVLRNAYPDAKVLFHDIDLHYLRMEREAALKESELIRRAAADMKVRELELCADVDCTSVPSLDERTIIQGEIGATNVVVYSYTSDIVPSPPLSEERRHIAFVGGFRHDPNIDAVRFFVQEVWPALKNHLDPDVKFYVIGPDAPADLKSLGDDRVIFTGYLEELSPVLDTCRAFVAPLRFGAGLKGKVVTALAHGLPCVATSIAIEGMALQDGRNVLVADGVTDIVGAVRTLFQDDERWRSLRREGLDFVSSAYSWEAGETVAKEAIETAGRVWAARRLASARARVALVNKELEAGIARAE